MLILGPLSEEIGWRGYALERLQTKWNALVSGLIVGLVWGLSAFAVILHAGDLAARVGNPIWRVSGRHAGFIHFVYLVA